jgi:predicted PurR-regulated permease PerM
MEEEIGKQSDFRDDARGMGIGLPSWRQSAAWLGLYVALLSAGLYILSNYLHALAWALVLAIALWPAYERILRRTSPGLAREALPFLFVALISLVILLPVATLAVDAVRELQEIVERGRAAGESGLPVPDFVSRLPYIGQWAADRWHEHLSHAGWVEDIAQQSNTSSIRQLGASLGANALHRLVLFGVSALTLFFLFRHGESLSTQCRRASAKLFGEKGERLALQMVDSVHGTVAGLVLVAMGEGILMGVVYILTALPHPILFGVSTAVAAMIPFAAVFMIGLAALVLLGNGGLAPAVVIVAAGFAIIFVADHFVRPKLIGERTKLPFLWVLLGIFGGVETFQLLGLFLGPAVMAALMMLWRELVEEGEERPKDPTLKPPGRANRSPIS